jgi:hypothetical protein
MGVGAVETTYRVANNRFYKRKVEINKLIGLL